MGEILSERDWLLVAECVDPETDEHALLLAHDRALRRERDEALAVLTELAHWWTERGEPPESTRRMMERAAAAVAPCDHRYPNPNGAGFHVDQCLNCGEWRKAPRGD